MFDSYGRRVKSPKFFSGTGVAILNVILLTTALVLISLHAGGVFKGSEGKQGAPGMNGGVFGGTEVFAIAMQSNHTVSAANQYEALLDWTDAVNPTIFPDVSTGMLFQNLSTGSLDLNTGTFTAGAAGISQFYYPQNIQGVDSTSIVRLVVKNTGNINSWQTDAAQYPIVLKLNASDTVSLEAFTPQFPATILAKVYPYFLPGNSTYNVVWTMIRIA